MSGHSKWAGIKHKKAAQDKKRGKLFSKLSRAITVAAREGGGDPDMNATLAQAIQTAKDANMPNDNIERAVKKGIGKDGGADEILQVTYEGYGPAGVAVYVTAMTDNKNRAASDVRHIFERHGGKLGTDGSVAWLFERKGVVFVEADKHQEDEVMLAALEAGAEDVLAESDAYEIRTAPEEFMAVRKGLEQADIEYSSADLTMVPKTTVELDESDAKKAFRLIESLEDNDDVQDVYANYEVSDEVMEALTG